VSSGPWRSTPVRSVSVPVAVGGPKGSMRWGRRLVEGLASRHVGPPLARSWSRWACQSRPMYLVRSPLPRQATRLRGARCRVSPFPHLVVNGMVDRDAECGEAERRPYDLALMAIRGEP